MPPSLFAISFCSISNQNLKRGPIDPVKRHLRFDCLDLLRRNPSIGIRLRELARKAANADLIIDDQSFTVIRRQKVNDPIESSSS